MTDRELLEYAAKAAGYKTIQYQDLKSKGLDVRYGIDEAIWNGEDYWNPLIDDGDALRLAVKIGKRDYFGIEIQKGCTQATSFEPWEHCEYEDHSNDPYAATRRAIVRAAAEIGKEMK